MKKTFIHIRQSSHYSLLDSSLTIKDIIELCRLNDMPAIALTDNCNMFGAFEFSLNCKKNGIQPILGVNLKINTFDKKKINSNILLLVKNRNGYTNLNKLMIQHYSDDDKINNISLDDLRKYSEGLICLTGGIKGPIGKFFFANETSFAEKLLNEFSSIYKNDLYIEISRHKNDDEIKSENFFLSLAHKYNIPIVATNNNLFSNPEMHEATDALLCIKNVDRLSDPDRKKVSKESCFKGTTEMLNIFSDLPEAINNTINIAKKCTFFLEETDPKLPKIFDSHQKENDELKNLAINGLREKLSKIKNDKKKEEVYQKRLDYELNIIIKTGYSGYFLIVADFISWAKNSFIPVGPGRGSGAGSLVAWSLGITDLDPLKYNLIFERFLNPDRVTLPDFDIDFCQEKRDEVLKYIVKKYGKKRVAQIITFGKLQSRNVIRDVGRVLQLPYSQVDNLAKLIPYNPANPISLSEAVNSELRIKDLQKNDDSIAKVINISLKLEGLHRHASTHAAGIVIGDQDLENIIPFYKDDPDTGLPVTQFSMYYIEQAGLIKFDFLGLKTLTILKKTCQLINKSKKNIDLGNIPLNDKKTFNLLKEGKTTGCFQLESSGVKEYLKKLLPDNFNDIIAMISLYRPGPMEYIENYIKRKHGQEDIIYLHPQLESVLKETYGITIYQEQVMQIAQVLANFSLSQADTLRWAIGKRKKKLMSSLRKDFIEGCKNNRVKEYQADSIFKQVETFAGYGFNKSHAAGYALIAYQTTFLKANYPVEFMTASMNYELNNTDKINRYLEDCKNMNIKILQPDINYSYDLFSIEKDNDNKFDCIRYGLAALKNVGTTSTQNISKERNKNGLFKNIYNFCKRLSDSNFNVRQFEYLIKSGSFDNIEKNRAKLFNNIDKIVQIIRHNETNKNQNDLFSNNIEESNLIKFSECDDWDSSTKINFEYESLGFYLTKHPLQNLSPFLKKNNFITYKGILTSMINVNNDEKKYFKIVAIPIDKNERTSKKGNKYAYVQFSDFTGNFEAIIFSDILSNSSDLIENHDPLILDLESTKNEGNINFRVQGLMTLQKFLNSMNTDLKLSLDKNVDIEKVKKSLNLCKKNDGIDIILQLNINKNIVDLKIPGKFDYFKILNNKIEGTLILN